MFPSLSQAIAALWEGNGDSVLGWRFAFWESVPLAAVAFSLMWWGMPQDPPQHDRFRVIDWRGMLLSLVGFGALSTMLQQGDRLDWWHSPLIVILTGCSSGAAVPKRRWSASWRSRCSFSMNGSIPCRWSGCSCSDAGTSPMA